MRKTEKFNFWIEPTVKAAALKKAEGDDESLARVLRRFLKDWVAESKEATNDDEQ